jgi:hypothetical protein
VKELVCLRTDGKLIVDGKLDKECWKHAVWSEPFGAVADGAPVHLETLAAFLWDGRCLYAAFKVEDPDARGTITGFHDHVYFHDEDVELFIEGEGLVRIMAGRTLPPKPGDSLRVMGYLAHHKSKKSGETAIGWSWGAMGNDNIHIPECWNTLVLSYTPPQTEVSGGASQNAWR